MHKAIVLAAILLCGCESKPMRQFNSAQAGYVRQVMEQCAAIIAKHASMLPPGHADWHYQRCLVQNNATI